MNKIKKVSALSALASDLSPDEPEISSPTWVKKTDDDHAVMKPIGTNFRMTPADWDRIKDLSKSERRSMQELLEEGLNAVFAKRGLQPLQGMPRRKY